jgi:putative flippase GtrA
MNSEEERVLSAMRRAYEAERRNVLDGSKFIVVGILNTALDLGLFNYLHFGSPHLGVLSAKAFSTLIGAISSYIMDRRWAFRDRAQMPVARDFSLFLLLNGAGLCIQLSCLTVVRYGLNLQSVAALNLAQLVGAAIGMVFRFFTYRRWVFPAVQPPSAN